MVIYLAHPIDLAGKHSHYINGLAKEAREVLADIGCTVYSPALAWQAQIPLPPAIQRVNNEALLASDGALFLIPDGVQTLGVPFELGLAHAYGIPSVIVKGSGVEQHPRAASALLAYLSDMPVFGCVDVVSACFAVANLAKHRYPVSSPRETNGDTNESKGDI
jgi:hypothetical protein